MNKKETLIFSIVLVALIVLPAFAHAQEKGPVQVLLDTLIQNFGFLLNPETANIVFYAKILFSLIIILPLYLLFSLGLGPKRKGIAGVLAFAIGMIAMMAIPNEVIKNLISIYSTISIIVFYILPIVGFFILYKIIENVAEEKFKSVAYVIEIIIAIAGYYYTGKINQYLSKMPDFQNLLGSTWISYVEVLFIIMALVTFYRLLVGSRSTAWKERHPTLSRPISSFFQGGGKAPSPEAEQQAEQQATAQEVAAAASEQNKINERLNNLSASMQAIPQTEQKELQDEANLINLLNGILPAVNDLTLLADITSAEGITKVQQFIETIRGKLGSVSASLGEIKTNCENGANIIKQSFNQIEGISSSLNNELATFQAGASRRKQMIADSNKLVAEKSAKLSKARTDAAKNAIQADINKIGNNIAKFSGRVKDYETASEMARNLQSTFKGIEATFGNINSLADGLKKKVEGEAADIQKCLDTITAGKYSDAYSSLRGVVGKIEGRRGDVLRVLSLNNDFAQKTANFKNEHNALTSMTANLGRGAG